MQRTRYPLLGITIVALCLFGLGGPGSDASAESALGGKFFLTDHTGQRVTNDDYKGKWILAFFGFTYCPDICPATLTTMSHVMEGLGADAGMVQPLFISVDPERDTPEVMASFVSAFHPSIVGLTGTPEEIKAAAASFGAYYAKVEVEGAPDGYLMEHMSFMYLLRPDGVFETVLLDSGNPETLTTQLRRHLRGAAS